MYPTWWDSFSWLSLCNKFLVINSILKACNIHCYPCKLQHESLSSFFFCITLSYNTSYTRLLVPSASFIFSLISLFHSANLTNKHHELYAIASYWKFLVSFTVINSRIVFAMVETESMIMMIGPFPNCSFWLTKVGEIVFHKSIVN